MKIVKATEQYFPVVLFTMLYKVVLTFESVDEILKCNQSNESYWAVLRFCCAVYYAVPSGSNWSVFNTHHLFKSWNSKFMFCNSYKLYKLLRLIICTLVSSGERDKFQWSQMRYYLVKLYLVTRTVPVNSYDLFKWYNWWNCISLRAMVNSYESCELCNCWNCISSLSSVPCIEIPVMKACYLTNFQSHKLHAEPILYHNRLTNCNTL